MTKNEATPGAPPPVLPRVLTVAGPSGVGKTTTVRALAGRLAGCNVHDRVGGLAYEERHAGNPYLARVLAGESGAVVEQSQRWFLDQVGSFVRATSPDETVVLDQDPAAIVNVYAEDFVRQSRLDGAALARLAAELRGVEETLRRWPGGRCVVVLDAPAAVLARRILGRKGAFAARRAAVPDRALLAWLERLRGAFAEFAERAGARLVPTHPGGRANAAAAVAAALGVARDGS